MLLVGWQEGHLACKNWVVGCWRGCLSGARCRPVYMAQLMPMPLIVSCFSKIQIGFTFLVPAHPGSPGQRAIKCVCVCDIKCYQIGKPAPLRLPVLLLPYYKICWYCFIIAVHFLYITFCVKDIPKGFSSTVQWTSSESYSSTAKKWIHFLWPNKW